MAESLTLWSPQRFFLKIAERLAVQAFQGFLVLFPDNSIKVNKPKSRKAGSSRKKTASSQDLAIDFCKRPSNSNGCCWRADIYDPAFCLRSTIAAIDEADIPHEHVVFEVVESDRSPDIVHLQNILSFYRDAGFQVPLDDLGTGYSGLNLIHQLRPDFIKLDMELTRNVHQDPYKALIAQKLLEITEYLNIQVIAEGIECEEELHWVRQHGATFVQGYLISKPAALPVTTTPYFENPKAQELLVLE